MLRTLASYFLGEGEGAVAPDGSRLNETSTVELMVARELNDDEEEQGDDFGEDDDDWVLVDDDGSEVDDEEEDEEMAKSSAAAPAAFVAPAPSKAKVKFETQEPEVTPSCSESSYDWSNDNNNSIQGSLLTASGLLLKRREDSGVIQGGTAAAIGDVDQDQPDSGLMDTDFAWENSLIEHPSVYIASHQQRRFELEEEKRLMTMKKSKRKSGRRRLGRTGRGQQSSAALVSSAASLLSSPPSTSMPDEESVARMGRSSAPTASGRSNNNGAAPGALEFLDVLKFQQEQQLLEQRRRGSGKRKHCIRDSRVHQNSCNKPSRRCDKQNYTRHSRMNNDRKCNKTFC